MKVILVAAITIDGKIGKDKDHFTDWTSKEDKLFFVEISKKHRVVLMGENTFNSLSAPLKDRLNVVFSQKQDLKLENVLWVSGEIEPILQRLEKMGHRSVVLGGGAFLNTLFLKKKLIDEIFITVEPKIFGQGISLFNDFFQASLKLLEVKKINENSLVLRYKVVYNGNDN